MKRAKKLLVFIFVFAFAFSLIMSSFTFADSGKANGKPEKEAKTDIKEDNTEKVKKGKIEDSEGVSKETVKEDKVYKAEDEEEKTDVNETAEEEQKLPEEKQTIKAEKTKEDKSLNEQEKESADKPAYIKLEKEERQRIRAEIRNSYSNEEMNALQEATDMIEEDNDDVDVLPVDSIITKNKKIKWDIPPVVKSGRMLVPVRAFTQAYGAEVEWDQEEQKVTIIKDGKEIVIELNNKTVYIDGIAVDLDVPAQSVNSRIVVPVRFIAEQMGLKVDFDEETDTVEIDEDEETDEEEVDEEEADEATDDTSTDDTEADDTVTEDTETDDTATDDITL